MDWKDFIQPMCEPEIFNKPASKILVELFVAAGRKRDFSESSVKKWLAGSRNCQASRYFPDGQVEVEKVFSYFRRRPSDQLQHLQQIFRNTENLDPSPIDVTTDDLDTFCWSLVNQFLDLLKFERIEIPKDAAANQKQATEKQPNSAVSMEPAVNVDASNSEKRSIRSVILPHNDDCCYHCDYWKGNRRTFIAYTKALPGDCEWHGQRRMSSDPPCQNYKKRRSQPGEW